MQENIKGIVLNVRKYNDRQTIVTMFTPSHGRISFISASGTGKSSNARRAKLQLLAVLETEINFKPGVELQSLGAVSFKNVWNDIYFHPRKIVQTIFLAEFLNRILNASMPDESLWEFIYESLMLLDSMHDGILNFHISFLVSLLPYMGIQPDVSGYSPEKVFDYVSGAFVWPSEARGVHLKGEEARAVLWVKRINFYNTRKLRLTHDQRRKLLSHILSYYSHHYPGIESMKSAELLQELN